MVRLCKVLRWFDEVKPSQNFTQAHHISIASSEILKLSLSNVPTVDERYAVLVPSKIIGCSPEVSQVIKIGNSLKTIGYKSK